MIRCNYFSITATSERDGVATNGQPDQKPHVRVELQLGPRLGLLRRRKRQGQWNVEPAEPDDIVRVRVHLGLLTLSTSEQRLAHRKLTVLLKDNPQQIHGGLRFEEQQGEWHVFGLIREERWYWRARNVQSERDLALLAETAEVIANLFEVYLQQRHLRTLTP